MLKLMFIQTSPLQLSRWKADGLFEAQSRRTFASNNLQTLNYMDRTIDSTKDFMYFYKFFFFFFNFPIALNKSPDINLNFLKVEAKRQHLRIMVIQFIEVRLHAILSHKTNGISDNQIQFHFTVSIFRCTFLMLPVS